MANELVKMAVDAYRGTTGEFSKEDVTETLRAKLIEIVGSANPDYKAMRRNGPAVFEIIEEALDILVVEGITNQFESFAEVRNMAWGDTNRFILKDTSLFKVATVADGTGNIRRQRIDNGSLTVSTSTKAIKIWEHLHRFLAGRIDWVEMVNRVAKSYQNELAVAVYNAIYNAYDGLTAPYAVSGTFDEADLIDLIAHVEAATGEKAVIVGTKKALAKVTPAVVSDNMKDTLNTLGHYGVFKGTELREIAQAHAPGTNTFAINDSFLMVLPTGGEKLVKIVFEGEAIVDEATGLDNADMSMEYTFIKKHGLAVLASKKYGIYRLS